MKSPASFPRAASFALGLALLTPPLALAEDWNNPGEGDWFNPLNWTPNAVPTASTDANINNGGTAVLGENAVDAAVRTLNVGVDGGAGTIRFEDFSEMQLRTEGGFQVGVTESGALPSTGVLRLENIDRISFSHPNGTFPLRIGYSSADGIAEGQVTAPALEGLLLPDVFSAVQIGVVEGSGDSSATVTVLGLRFGTQGLVEVGVSRGTGAAQARVFSDPASDPTIGNLLVGVATDTGHANGWIRTGTGLGGDSPSGNAQVGVSQSSGEAIGGVDLERATSTSRQSFGPYLQLDIGVSNGDGDANGTVLTGAGLRAEILNLGLSNGSGVGTGLIRTDHLFSRFDTMNLGPGATVLLNAGSNVRGSESRDTSAYGAINVESAVLDGTLVVDFDYIPDGPTRFELINSAAADGLSGDFATVELLNLNPGLAWTSGIVLDGGVEKYVLDLTGAPVFPEWTDPGADDWFDAGNWSNNRVPDSGQPALILNGGEARADNATAPGPLQAFQFGIGLDGGSGTLVVDGVDLETTSNLQVGVIRREHVGGGTAIGFVELTDAELRLIPEGAEDDPAPAVPTGDDTSIGIAFTTGTAEGALTLDGATFSPGFGALRIGGVDIDATDTGAVAKAEGGLVVSGGTELSDISSLRAALALVDADGASGTGTADIQISNSTIERFFSIGEAEADGIDSTANTSATVVMTDAFIGAVDFAEIEVDGEGGTASSTIMATLERVATLSEIGGASIQVTECDAEAPGARVLPSVVELTVNDSLIGLAGSEISLDLSEIETEDDGISDCTGRAQFTDSELMLINLNLAEGQADESSTAIATAEVTITRGSLSAFRVRIGEGDPGGDGVTIVDGRLWLQDTIADVSGDVIVGFYDDDGEAVGNTITARLGLTGSNLSTPLLEIGVENPVGHPLDALVTLNPSYLETDFLHVGPDGRLELFVEGPNPATRDNLDQEGLYAVADAVDALIEGEVVVQINYSAPRGASFDVLRTAPGALANSPGRFRVGGASPDAVDLEVVSEDGADVLRLTALRDLTRANAQPIPAQAPPALLFATLILLLVISGAALRRSRRVDFE